MNLAFSCRRDKKREKNSSISEALLGGWPEQGLYNSKIATTCVLQLIVPSYFFNPLKRH